MRRAVGPALARSAPTSSSACYALAGLAVGWLARRPGWSPAHVAALATGWLTAFAVFSFWTEPIGTVTAAEKLGHNLAALCLLAALGALAVLRSRALAADPTPHAPAHRPSVHAG